MDQTELSDPTNTTKYYIPDGGTFANGKIWAVASVIDASGAVVTYQDTLAIYEGTVQNGSVSFLRRPISLPVDMGPDNPFSWQIAFSPDGQTGYIAGLGRLDSIAYPKRASNLIWMKSTDAGATWSVPSEVYYADDTLITNNIGDSVAATVIASAQFEMDLVVDTFGNPHTLFNIEWRPDNDYGFTYVGPPSTIWHVYSPDGGSNWNFKRVFTTQVRYGGIGTDPDDSYQQNRPQLSRDKDGRYILMSYFDTDTTLLINPTPCTGFTSGYCGNSDRFINTSAYNVVKDYYAPVKAWDFFLQGSYTSNFECISEIAPVKGSMVVIPYEYMKITDKVTDNLAPVEHYYESGVGYTKEELGDTSTVGLSSLNLDASTVKLFPNPTNSELNILFEEGFWNSNVKIYNNMGQVVLTSQESEMVKEGKIIRFNVSTLNEGIYFLRLGESSSRSLRFIKH